MPDPFWNLELPQDNGGVQLLGKYAVVSNWWFSGERGL